jgi:ADP-heptose:LPS heptosyltransferase
MKILMIQFRSLGDCVMITPIIHAVKQKYPDAIIDIITEKQNKNIFELNPDINQIIIGDNYFDANIIGIEGKYDKIYRLNMANLLDTCWHHLPEHQNQNLQDWYAKRAEINDFNDNNFYLYFNEDDEACIDDLMFDYPKDKLIAIHTSSGAHKGNPRVESKDWNKYSELASILIDNGYNVIQIGAFNDKKINDKRVLDATGKISFKQNALLLKKCELFIGNDSGPSYLASWAGIPSIVIMGSTQNYYNQLYGKLGPFVGPRSNNVHYINSVKPNDCQPVPCYNHCALGNPCIYSIELKTILDKIKEIKGIALDKTIDNTIKFETI